MIFQFSAGVVVYCKKKEKMKYLLLLNSKGHWDFPKGKIEKSESKQMAALRELKEEACIDAKLDPEFEYSFEYIFTDKNGELIKKRVYYFIGEAETNKVKISFEHTDFAWLDLEEALSKLSFKDSRQMLIEANKFLRDT